MERILLTKEDLKGTIYESHFDNLKALTQKKVFNLEQLANTICSILEVDFKDFIGKSRKRELVNARSIFSYIARNIDTYENGMFKNSLREIGEVMNRDHSTIVHLVSRAEHEKIYPDFRNELKEIINTVYGNEDELKLIA